MAKPIRTLTPAAFVALSLLHLPAGAAEGEAVDMTEYSCKDIMRMSDHERAVAVAVLHGYRLGKRGETSFVSNALAKMSNDFVEHCLDNPHDKAMASFEKITD